MTVATAAEPPTEKVADPPTYHEYPGVENSAEYFHTSANPGRIWTDKTVFDQDVPVEPTHQQPGVGDLVLGPDELAVSLSALGSTRHVSSEVAAPVDLVLVLDNSGSMRRCVESDSTCTAASGATGWQNSRAWAMTEAVDAALRIIGEDNPANRVGLVQFGTGSGTLEVLGSPQLIPGTDRYAQLTRDDDGLMTFRTANGSMTIGYVAGASQGTNIHLGVATGLRQLAAQPSAEVTGENQRVPNLLLFTDGEPTYSATNAGWWNPGTGIEGPGSGTPYDGNGFKAAIAAAYLKSAVDDAYDLGAFAPEDPPVDVVTSIYTVGLGITGLPQGSRNLALATLDPSDTRVGLPRSDTDARFADYFATYASGRSVTVPVNLGSGWNSTYTVGHPTGDAAAYDPDTLAYNDRFYAPITTDDMIDAFEDIASQIVDAAPNYPVDISGGSATTDGYVTFTDELGAFMGVSEMSRLTFCSTVEGTDPSSCEPATFQEPDVTVDGTVTRYTFEGTYTANDVFGPADVDDLIIEVTRDASLAVGDVVTVRVPASLLPMRDTRVTEDENGVPVDISWWISHPVHLYYKVAPKEGVIDAVADPLALNGPGSQDGTSLAQHIAANTVDGQVRFYSDHYVTTDAADASRDVARTQATFVPAQQNNFYRFATDTTLNTTDELATPVTPEQWDTTEPDETVYYPNVVYRELTDGGYVKEDAAFPITKQELLDGQDAAHQLFVRDGAMTIPAGMADVSERTHNLSHLKCSELDWSDNTPACTDPVVDGETAANLTGTDPWARQTSVTPERVTSRLGNNGFVTYAVPGDLTIAKTVEAAPGLNPVPDQAFTFGVALSDADGAPLSGPYPYSVYAAGDTTTPVDSGTVGDGDTVTMAADQTIRIIGLPDGATWSVTETGLPPGYTQTVPADGAPATGQIDVDAAVPARAEFTNSYSPAPVDLAGPAAAKVLDGRDWVASDEFVAQLCGPAETGGGCTELTLTEEAEQASFPAVTYETPGTYTYTITERDDHSLHPALSFSAAAYQWVVTVTDDGSGTLSATGELTQLRDDDGVDTGTGATQAAFTNSYDPAEVGSTLNAAKLVRDLTVPGDAADQTRPPALAHDFRYWLLGADDEPAPPAPAFPGGTTEAVVSNAPGSAGVASPRLTFTGDHAGQAYYYAVAEAPDPPLPFVDYDDAAFVYRLAAVGGAEGLEVTISRCETTVSAMTTDDPYGTCTPGEGSYSADTEPQFLNVYDADPGTLSLEAAKVLDGRPWTAQDEFTFELGPNDEVTAAAVEAGTVVLPTTEVTVTADDVVDGAAPVVFGEISFAQQGRYQFRVTESVPQTGPGGLTYDTRVVLYNVSVTDADVDGVLEVASDVVDRPTFTNRYRATALVEGADIVKTLSGRQPQLGEFTFQVEAADEASAAKLGDDVVTLTNGNESGDPTLTTLPTLSFTQDDLGQVFSYTLTEVAGGLPGVTYDDTVWSATVEPRYDDATGALWTLTTLTDGTRELVSDSRQGTVPQVPFVNEYVPAPVTVEPSFTKVLTGRDWGARDEFAFTVEALGDNPQDVPMPGRTEVTVTDEAGADPFGFGEITYTAPGRYEYLVREVPPEQGLPGLVYDGIAAHLVVTVTDVDGTLQADVAYDGNEEFENAYLSQYAWRIDVTKTMTGRDLAPEEFTFRVVPADEESARFAGLPADGTTFTNADGAPEGEESHMTRLTGILLTQADAGNTYCYEYSEVVPEAPEEGVTYDDTTHELCAEIADDGAGAITVRTTVTGSDGSTGSFTNSSADPQPSPWPRVPFVNAYDEAPTPSPTPTPTPGPTDPGPTPGPTSEPTPSTPPGGDGGAGAGGGAGGAGDGGGGYLPFTGIDLNALLAILGCAALLLATGATLVTITRRRRRD